MKVLGKCRFIRIASLLVLIFGSGEFLFAQDRDGFAFPVHQRARCPEGFAALGTKPVRPFALRADSSFEDLKAAYAAQLRRDRDDSRAEAPLSVLERANRVRASIQRLVEPQYDEAAGPIFTFTKVSVPAPSRKMDDYALMASMKDWSNGVHYIAGNAEGRPLSRELLQDLHRLACANMNFHGFEGRRIARRFKAGEITKEEFQALLKRAYSGDSVSGVDHRELVGTFRKDAIDELSHHGSQTEPGGRRYFSDAEFEGFSRNPLMRLVPGSKKVEPDGKIRAEFRYLEVSRVPAAVDEIIERTNRALATSRSLEEKVKAIATLQRDLLSAHPFLDGNGRTVRLLTDLLYQRIGLPSPARPNGQDLEMPIEKSVEYVREQMIRTLNIKSGAVEP